METPIAFRKAGRSCLFAGVITTLACAGLARGAPADRGVPPSPPREQPPAPPQEEPAESEGTPELISKVEPVYPDSARREGITGVVIVQVLVGMDGRVKEARVQRSIPALDQAALAAAKQWIFKPALEDGRPVAVWVAIPMRFGSLMPDPGRNPPAIAGQRADFERDLAALHARGACVPSDSDEVLRGRIIEAARLFSPMPSGPIEAIEHRESALRTLKASHVRDSLERAVGELAQSLDEAPWWAPPYRDLAGALERLGRREEAAISLELFLAADPKASDAEKLRLEIQQLRAKKRGSRR